MQQHSFYENVVTIFVTRHVLLKQIMPKILVADGSSTEIKVLDLSTEILRDFAQAEYDRHCTT